MRLGHRIGVIIPALNEELAIARVISDIPAWVDCIVVVDNGSVDETADNAAAAGATVLLEVERGYGAACLRGIKHLNDVDLFVFLDGDYSDDPSQMADLVDPILCGHAEFVVGSRVLANPEDGALLPHQIAGNRLACFLMRRLFNARYTDLGPFRAIRASSLANLDMRDRNFGWTVEMQVKAVQRSLTITEVPVRYRRRIGRSKISGTISGSIKAGYTIVRVIAASVLATVPHHADVSLRSAK